MYCRCNDPVIRLTNEHTEVCINCGVEKRVLLLEPINISYSQSMSVNATQNTMYSRSKRFASMLDQIVLGSWCQSDEKMVDHLKTSPKFKTVKDMMTVMKTSKLRDKRYSSIHYFSRCFLRGSKRPDPVPNWLETRRVLVQAFSDFERVFRIHMKQPFVSYAWILQKFLNVFGLSRFIPYIKVLKCKRRQKKYEMLFKQVSEQLRISDTPSIIAGV